MTSTFVIQLSSGVGCKDETEFIVVGDTKDHVYGFEEARGPSADKMLFEFSELDKGAKP